MSQLLDTARAGRPLPFKAIDMHGHFGRYGFGIPGGTPQWVVAEMDRIGVGALLVSHMQCMSTGVERGNAAISETVHGYPGRFLGYMSAWPGSAATVAASAQRWFEAGLRGVKVHDGNGFAYDDPAYRPLYELANAHRLPVLFHTWGQDRQFEAIGTVAADFPQTSILLAHAGCDRPDTYIEFAAGRANVYLDPTLSASPRGMLKRLCDGVGVDKVVWGSDSVFLAMSQQLGKVAGADLPDAAKRKILRDNAVGILARIEPPLRPEFRAELGLA